MSTHAQLDADARLRASDDAQSTSFADETVILDPVSGTYFGLDNVGTRVWNLLQSTTTLTAMVRVISDEYDVDAETCERDLRVLLADLDAKGLIVREHAA